MTNEVRDALERYRKPYPDNGPKDEWYGNVQLFDDMQTLAQAYLDEHPADDHEPIDEAWLRSVGFEERNGWELVQFTPMGGKAYFAVSPLNGCFPARYFCDWNCDSVYKFVETRGELRRLCKSLGVEMREQK